MSNNTWGVHGRHYDTFNVIRSGMCVVVISLLMCHAGCSRERENDGAIPVRGLLLRMELVPGGFEVQLKNTSSVDQVVVNQLDPAYAVLELKITDRKGKSWPVAGGWDWWLFTERKDDVRMLHPGEEITREVSFGEYKLRPGHYEVQAEYTVSPASFFVEPCLRELMGLDPKERKLVESLWYGTVKSQKLSFSVGD